jgi:hypothetical protein
MRSGRLAAWGMALSLLVVGAGVSVVSAQAATTTTTTAAVTTTSTTVTTTTTTTLCDILGVASVPDETVSVGGTATFTGGDPCPSTPAEWLVSTDGGASFAPVPGATSLVLTVPDVTAAENGNEYELVVAPDGELIAGPATLHVVNPTPPPTITRVLPARGSTSGGVAIILGTGFTRAQSVSFGGVTVRPFLVISGRMMLTLVPPHAAGTVDVTVTGAGGTSATSSADRYTYVG